MSVKEIKTFEDFQLIDTGEIKIGLVSAAGRTSGFITEGGSMRMFGSNDAGQLGYGEDAVTNPNTPIVANSGEDLENATIIKYNSSFSNSSNSFDALVRLVYKASSFMSLPKVP